MGPVTDHLSQLRPTEAVFQSGAEAHEAPGEGLAELPLWLEVTESLREAGLLVANSPLCPVDTATAVRVRGGETEITDGPFAVTKEVLAGCYVTAHDGAIRERGESGSAACAGRLVAACGRQARGRRPAVTRTGPAATLAMAGRAER